MKDIACIISVVWGHSVDRLFMCYKEFGISTLQFLHFIPADWNSSAKYAKRLSQPICSPNSVIICSVEEITNSKPATA